MQNLTGKTPGGELTAAEWNQLPQEVQNIITDLGIALVGGDTDQLGKAIAAFLASGDYYSESGIANAYVITPIGSRQGPASLHEGMVIRFRPGAANTGASTVNVNSLGIKDLKREDGTVLQFGDLNPVYDTFARYDVSAGDFFVPFYALTGGSAAWTTGDVKLTMKTSADTGWVLMVDTTIGSSGSGADRANADCEALFTLLWDTIIDTWCPVSGGRGVSAAADWAADKTLDLPLTLGRALAVSGEGAGLTSRVLGENHGDETHDHGGSTGIEPEDSFGVESEAWQVATDDHTHPISSDSSMQPTAFLNVMIKL